MGSPAGPWTEFQNAQPAQSEHGPWEDFQQAPPAAPPEQPPTKGYQAVPEEQTAEGHAAAVAAREKEHPLITAMGKGAGEVLTDVKDALNPVNIAKSAWDSFPPVGAYQSIQNAIPVIRAYESARAAGKTVTDSLAVADELAKQQNAVHQTLQQRAEEFKKAPGQATVHALGDIATLAATFFEGPKALGESGLPEAGAVETVAKPSLVQQVVKGEKVAQPMAESAVRTAVGGAAEKPLVDIGAGKGTIVDEHLANLRKAEKAAYQEMDDVAEFDVKAERKQLANDQAKLKQLGNTEADVNQRGKLIESINDSQDRIKAAEQRLQEHGIDPAAADKIHQQRMAGIEFKNRLIANADPTTGEVNIKGLLRDAKKARFSKYGDRLEQFFGSKDAADKYVADLQEADKAGIKAMSRQEVGKRVGRWIAEGVIGASAAGAAYGAYKSLQ